MKPEDRAHIRAAARELVDGWGPLAYPQGVIDDIAFLLQPTGGGTTHPVGGAGTGPGRDRAA
ncbi:hypothetical protein [Amycolatopsis thermoflava]|uniref:hypothetical protein n=1 Tax=Amycolatopsis thermoflava TaxID=84480 RepID=UPI0004130C62|nr:hypothetical protein [Amycolatopsis thermoflava]